MPARVQLHGNRDTCWETDPVAASVREGPTGLEYLLEE